MLLAQVLPSFKDEAAALASIKNNAASIGFNTRPWNAELDLKLNSLNEGD